MFTYESWYTAVFVRTKNQILVYTLYTLYFKVRFTSDIIVNNKKYNYSVTRNYSCFHLFGKQSLIYSLKSNKVFLINA